jgi:NAD(P)-dependent dehydrogenase (short-subunit alcohol dehydrogenase family)
MTDSRGKVALITGSARGIGKAIAERFASLGANVVVNYSSDEKNARETVDNIRKQNVRAVAVKADITKVAEILFSVTLQEFGKLDIVVANAGREIVDLPIVNATEVDFDRIFADNDKGVYFTFQYAANMWRTTDGSSMSAPVLQRSQYLVSAFMDVAKWRLATGSKCLQKKFGTEVSRPIPSCRQQLTARESSWTRMRMIRSENR